MDEHGRRAGAGRVRIVRVLALSGAILAGLGLTTVAGLWAWTGVQTPQAERALAESLGTKAQVIARYARAEPNDSAREVERLAAPLGFNLAPRRTSRRSESFNARHDAAYEEFMDLLGEAPPELLDQMRSAQTLGIPEVTGEVRTFFESRSAALADLRRHLREAPIPRWECTVEHLDGPAPALADLLKLQKFLALDALIAIQHGDRERALADVESGWRLAQSLESEPAIISHTVRLASLRIQLAVLRQIIPPSPEWIERLQRVEIREPSFDALRFYPWWVFHYFEENLERSPEGRTNNLLWHLLLDITTAEYASRGMSVIDELERRESLCPRSGRTELEGPKIELPKWNPVAMLAVPLDDDSGLKGALLVGMTEYVLELTRRWLSFVQDTLTLIDEGSYPEGVERWEEPSTACAGESWRYERTPERIRLRFSREIPWNDGWLPQPPSELVADVGEIHTSH